MMKFLGVLVAFVAAFFGITLVAMIGSGASTLSYQVFLENPGVAIASVIALGFLVSGAFSHRKPIVSAIILLLIAGMLWLPTLIGLMPGEARLLTLAARTLATFGVLLVVVGAPISWFIRKRERYA